MRRHPAPKGCPLTPRQWEVLQGVAEGGTYRHVAQQLGIAPSTVRTILHNAYARLRVHTGPEAIALAYSVGWMDPVDTSYEDGRLTAAQSLYVQAFDRLLLARGEKARTRARAEMKHLLGTMCIERQIPVPSGGRQILHDPLGRLIAAVCVPW